MNNLDDIYNGLEPEKRKKQGQKFNWILVIMFILIIIVILVFGLIYLMKIDENKKVDKEVKIYTMKEEEVIPNKPLEKKDIKETPENWDEEVKEFYDDEIVDLIKEYNVNEPITRAEFINLMYKHKTVFFDDKRNTISEFQDIKGEEYETMIEWGWLKGIVYGKSNTNFGYNDELTKEQMIVFLYRSMPERKDSSNSEHWSSESVKWGKEKGLIKDDDIKGETSKKDSLKAVDKTKYLKDNK